MSVVVKEVNEDSVVVDANHPLAGETLHFAVKIDSVREATESELAHGHAHGGDGHHH
jgi:FKBP-type peptidyl-prolyl cis-trans isomerase SlyD